MIMDRVFGIDLGTTNSVIAHTDGNGVTEVVAGQDGSRIVPSVVYFPSNGDPVVGTSAKQRAITEPERIAQLFKRGMGERTFTENGEPFVIDGKTWSPEELSALVLRKLAQMAQEQYGEPARRVVITVPAYFGEAERAATQSAGELAGLEVLRILNEPTAAALAHGLDHPGEPGRILVFDLGGGTFDVTIMDVRADGAMEVVATGGDRRLGGMDFDRLLVERMTEAASGAGLDIATEAWARQDAFLKAEELKKELSTLDSSSRSLTGSGRPLQFDLTRGEFEKLLSEKLREVEDTTLGTIERAGLEPASMTSVLMVGGSCRIPAFQKLLASAWGREPAFSRNLDEDVARGAAILAAKLGGELDPRSQLAKMPPPVDVASQGLGVSMLDTTRNRMVNAVIIEAQTPVPVTREEIFNTVAEGQTQVEIELNEGDDEDLEYVKQIAKGTGKFGRAVPLGYPVRVELAFTADQIIRLRAYDGESGSFLCELEVERPGNLSKDERNQARQFLSRMEVQ
jgi:molecular chaperone DnaK